MREEIISFETAQLAKEKGFIFDKTLEPYYEGYHGFFRWHNDKNKITSMSFFEQDATNSGWVYMNIGAPTQSLLQRWLREEHNIMTSVDITDEGTYFHALTMMSTQDCHITGDYTTYEEGVETVLRIALERINN